MKIVILDALTFGETDLGGFDKFGDVEVFQTTAPGETLKRVANADVIVTNKVVIDASVMAQCETLKLICITATGMNNVDLEAASSRGVAVKNVAGYSTDSVIQHTFTMLFYLMGHSRYYDEYVKAGQWQQSPVFTHVTRPFFEVKGKRWGIIGLGEIGRGVAKVASAFGAKVSYYSTSGKNTNSDYTQKSLEALLAESDIVTIHAPLNDATNNLLDYEKLSLLKPGAVLLNLGRGGIVNEADLARIIDEKLLYAGLDVLAKEPMTIAHPLMDVRLQERLYITPHIAWTSVEAREKLIALTCENIETFING